MKFQYINILNSCIKHITVLTKSFDKPEECRKVYILGRVYLFGNILPYLEFICLNINQLFLFLTYK